MKFIILAILAIFANCLLNLGVVNIAVPTNVETYVSRIIEAKTKGLDFVTFPELALAQSDEASEIVTVGASAFPGMPIQTALSKAAKDNNIWVGFDFREAGELCTPEELAAVPTYCRNINGEMRAMFNTYVVFDGEGKVHQKYRKTNIFWGLEFFKPGQGIPVVINAPFGKFGVVVCFDIVNQKPFKDMMDLGIKDVVLATWWDDVGRAGYTALPVFQGISKSFGINLYAANILYATSGSAIYESGVTRVAYSLDENKLIVAADGNRITNPNMVYRLAFASAWFPYLGDKVYEVTKLPQNYHGVFETAEYTCTIDVNPSKTNTGYWKIGALAKMGVFMTTFDACGVWYCENDEVCADDNLSVVAPGGMFDKILVKMEYKPQFYSGFMYPALTGDYLGVHLGNESAFKFKRLSSKVIGEFEYKADNEAVLNAGVYHVSPTPGWI